MKLPALLPSVLAAPVAYADGPSITQQQADTMCRWL
jgi:hypothetical protein